MTLGKQEDYEVPVETRYDDMVEKIRCRITYLTNQEPYQYGSDAEIEFLEDLLNDK